MPRGISINVGLNSVDPAQYGPHIPTLKGSENDARDMHEIARSRGFDARLLLAGQANSNSVTEAVREAAGLLKQGDILLLTYSGHGSQIIDDINGDEDDGMDETLVLYDRNLLDDELYSLWGEFKAGVRILFISDSCHSGTQAFVAAEESPALSRKASVEKNVSCPPEEDGGFFPDTGGGLDDELDEDGQPRLDRVVTAWMQHSHLARFEDTYDSIRTTLTHWSKVEVRASVIQLGACQDDQKARDGVRNGLFTGKLREVWDDGSFAGDYNEFFGQIRSRMPLRQKPKFYPVGVPSPDFEGQTPFSI